MSKLGLSPKRIRRDWARDAAKGARIAARMEELIAESARKAA